MVGYKDGGEVNWGSWSKGGTCRNDKPGHVGEEIEREGMMERKEGGTCHNDKPGHGEGNGRGRSVGWSYFLPFPLAAGA